MDTHQQDTPVPVTDTSSVHSKWSWCGSNYPRQEVVFFAQIIIIYIVIICCIINLSLGHSNSNLWVALLSSCLGYLLPSPSMQQHSKYQQNGSFLHHPSQ